MQRDNVDTSIFPQSQLASLRIGGAQYGLPVSIESVVAAVNLGILDEMGLAAPDDGWDYKAAEKLFRATTVTGHDEKTHRYGGAFYFYAEYYPEEYYLRQFGGSYVDPQDAGKCNLSAEGSIACGEYIYPLLQEGICTTDWAYSGKFPNNLLTVGLCGSFMLPQFAAYPATLKYRFMPLPKGPVMGATFGSPAFYAIPSTTKVADAAWRLLRWMSFEPDFQQANMKFGLLPPASLKLYGDFVDVVKAVAPPLRDKNVEAFSAWVTDGHAFPDPFFKYNTGSAFNLLNTDLAKILTAHASVRETFVQAAAHVDAYEAVAAAQQTSVASAERRFPTSGPAIAAVPEGV
jgi:ABC-type glycerol-3-phosphate transport system substrate-binding protein